jgi:hypothetical protein
MDGDTVLRHILPVELVMKHFHGGSYDFLHFLSLSLSAMGIVLIMNIHLISHTVIPTEQWA